jgi:hypothetical protein
MLTATYNLLVSDAKDTEPSKKGRFARDTLRSYGDGRQSVIVTGRDVTGENIEIIPEKAANDADSPN